MQMGFLARTPRGRCVTDAAYRHLGMQPPPRRAAAQDGPRQQSFDDLGAEDCKIGCAGGAHITASPHIK